MGYQYYLTSNYSNFKYNRYKSPISLRFAHHFAKTAKNIYYIIRVSYDDKNKTYVARVLGYYDSLNKYHRMTLSFNC